MNKNTLDSALLINSIKSAEGQIIKLVHQRFGIVIHPHQTYELNKTIFAACHKFNCNIFNYLEMIATYPEESPILKHLISGITVNETYFFRDKNQMELLQKTVLRQLINSKREGNHLSLKIWSAGCSTGEEIYTIGMMLAEILPDITNWRIHLLGTDLNTNSLQKAMAGLYTEWSMRSIPAYYKQKYFTQKDNHYILSEKIREWVAFSYLNLNDNTYPSLLNGTNAQDLILCRNVLIYFNNAHIPLLMKKLSKSLSPGGFILLGASNPLIKTDTDLIFHHDLGMLLSRPLIKSPPIFSKPMLDNVQSSKQTTPIYKPLQAKILSTTKLEVEPTSKVASSVLINKLPLLLNENSWQEALDVIHSLEAAGTKDSSLSTYKALAYANLGQLDLSLQTCETSIKIDPTNKNTYFTYALTLIELNRLKDAEEAFRKTLFLDRNFVMGHFQLGLLLLRMKEHTMGMKSLANALVIAQAKPPTEQVPGYQGLDYGKLSDIFKKEIKMHTEF